MEMGNTVSNTNAQAQAAKDNTQASVKSGNLTEQLMDIISYLAEAQKKFVNKTVDSKINETISKYEEELGKTKNELEELVKALDNLDFKEDGKIDPKVITGKVADLEAAVNTIKEKIENLSITNNDEAASDDVQKLEADIKIIQTDIKEIKDKIIAALTERVDALEKNVSDLQKQVNNLQVDVDKIKAQIDKSFV